MIIRKVYGISMAPTLKPGRVVIAIKRQFKVNDIVIAKIEGREVVKRVTSKEPCISLTGDNKLSAEYFQVAKEAIMGVVIWPKTKH